MVREGTRDVPLRISRGRSCDCCISFTKRWPTATWYIFIYCGSFCTFFAVYYSISNFAMRVVVELVNLARLIGGL